jgi:hypothetical protein
MLCFGQAGPACRSFRLWSHAAFFSNSSYLTSSMWTPPSMHFQHMHHRSLRLLDRRILQHPTPPPMPARTIPWCDLLTDVNNMVSAFREDRAEKAVSHAYAIVAYGAPAINATHSLFKCISESLCLTHQTLEFVQYAAHCKGRRPAYMTFHLQMYMK